MSHRLLTIMTGLLLATTLHAQDDTMRQLLDRARDEYQIGHVEETRQLLLENIKQLHGTERQEAYRLLSLCSLAEHDEQAMERYALQLLDENPYYTPSLQDPQLFAELINTLKASLSTKITTASRQAETLEETPVPVTLITEEMIRLSTARNLQELLAEYVPGMGIQEGRLVNLVVRGILGKSPDNILVMRDGVRLNSFYNNEAPLDFRISLANVKQIEVLRGSASSLYGNAALMAVVNIITKDGKDVDGVQLSAGVGNWHTLKADILAGKQFMESNLTAWGSIYNSRGTRWDIAADSPQDNYDWRPDDGYIYVGGYNHRPSYDLGLNYTWKHLTLYASHQHGKHVVPYPQMTSELYAYDEMPTINGEKPGQGSTVSTVNLRYTNSWNRWSVEANATGTYETFRQFEPRKDLCYLYLSKCNLYNLGADIKAVYKYPASKWGEGSILMGLQLETFEWLNEEAMFFTEDNTDEAIRILLEQGIIDMNYFQIDYNLKERTLSPFMQLKHSFSKRLIANVGLRYDIRDRAIGTNISKLSPRLALIYMPSQLTSLKLAYGQSFVDMNLLGRIRFVGEDVIWIKPHRLDNIQLSSIFNLPKQHLKLESNIFYNSSQRVRELSYGPQNTYVKNIGWENVLSYSHRDLQVRLSTYLQHVISTKNVDDSEWPSDLVRNPEPPAQTCSDVMLRLKLSKKLFGSLWLSADGSFASKTQVYANSNALPNRNDPAWEAASETDFLYTIPTPARFLLDLSARYTWRNLDFSIICKNALNHTYRLVGESTIVLQQRRTLLATLTVNLH